MTKPLPYGCIKKQEKIPSLVVFNIILNNILHKDKIGHLFVVDIKFHEINEKLFCFTSIFEKCKLTKPYEGSVLQLLIVMSRNEEKGIINTFKYNEKTHSTMKKKIIPLYAEHTYFLVTRASRLVTKIYVHCNFEQLPFEKEFVTMNQFARQKAKTSVEKYFYKLMSNSNFGTDCTNNINNCQFEAIYDEIGDISFIKKYANIFGNSQYKDFACIKTMKKEIEQTYNNQLLALDPNDPTSDVRKYSIKEREKELTCSNPCKLTKKRTAKNEPSSILKIR